MATVNFENRITELETKIKELLANYPDRQVDFEIDANGCEWKGEEYDYLDFSIYEEISWDWNGDFLVTSISLNADDELVYSLFASGVTSNGNGDCEDMGDWTIKEFNRRIHSQEQAEKVIQVLEFFTEIL